MRLKLNSILWAGSRIFIITALFFCISFIRESIPEYKAKNLDKPIFKSAYKNRNIASFYGDTIQATDQLLKNKGNLIPNRPSYKTDKTAGRPYGFDKVKQSSNNDIDVNDIYISIKTSKKYHSSRLQVILETWFQQAKNQTYFFTDAEDPHFQKLTGGHMVNTYCKESHTRHDLSCKMSAEYDGYMAASKKWWCHFDDDNYVNIDRLVALLRRYKWTDDVYLGRPSLGRPFYVTYKNKKEKIWFATGGAGVCISNPLAQKMAPWSENRELMKTSDALRVPDDCTLGFIISNRLSANLTRSNLLHSHLERLKDLDFSSIASQVTLSYHLGENGNNNVISFPQSVLLQENDPTRFKSFHCHLHSSAHICR